MRVIEIRIHYIYYVIVIKIIIPVPFIYFISKFVYLLFMFCVWVFVCMYVYVLCAVLVPVVARRGHCSSWHWRYCRYWELYLGHVEEQLVLLTVEQSLQVLN